MSLPSAMESSVKMSSSSIQVGSEYVFSRLHGIWSSRLHGESLQALARVESESELVRQFGERGIVFNGRKAFHRDLKVRELGIFDTLRRTVDDCISPYYRGFMRQAFYGNVKLLLHLRAFDENVEEVASLLIPSPLGSLPDLSAIQHVESVEEFLRCIGAGGSSEGMSKCLVRFVRDHDVQLVEGSLDRLSYEELYVAVQGLPLSLRCHALELLGEEIDILNLGLALRNVQTYHYSRQRLSELFLPHGRHLGIELLCELGSQERLEMALSGLPHVWRSVVSGQDGQSGPRGISGMVRAGVRHLYHHALHVFRLMEDMSLPLVAFPYLQRVETLNIGRLYECVHFRMSSRETSELLID